MADGFKTESESQRDRLVRILSAAAFLIFFQANMIAPLIPRLGFSPALAMFSAVELADAIAAIPLFHFETAPVSKTVTTSQ